MNSRKILSIISLTLAAVLLLGIGFAIGRNDEKKTVLVAPTESTAPRLIISAVHADSEYTSEKNPADKRRHFRPGLLLHRPDRCYH